MLKEREREGGRGREGEGRRGERKGVCGVIAHFLSLSFSSVFPANFSDKERIPTVVIRIELRTVSN
jgi:hypothetical protein